MAREYSNTSVQTTLSNSIGPSDTQIQIDTTSGLPVSFPFTLVIDHGESNVEVVTVTGLAGPNLVVTRGEDGTGAQSHSSGAVVVHAVTARDLAEPQDHIDAATNVHGVGAGSSVVGTATSQTLTNKTISGADNTVSLTFANITDSRIGQLDDVDVAGVSDGDVLVFRSSSGAWEANPPSSLAINLDDVNDVNAPSPGDGQVLAYNGGASEWVPTTLAFETGDLTDVDYATPPVDGDVLVYNNGNWVPGVTGETVASVYARSLQEIIVNSTSDIGSGFGVSFVAPPSGRVQISWRDRLSWDKTAGNLRRLVSRIAVRTGSVVGAGSVVRVSNDDDSVELGAAVNGEFGMRGNGSSFVEVDDLTPGSTYNVEIVYRLNETTGTTASSQSRTIQVIGIK